MKQMEHLCPIMSRISPNSLPESGVVDSEKSKSMFKLGAMELLKFGLA